MRKNQLTKKYEDLTFSDDFMFCKVLESNPDLCCELLELILGRKIGELAIVERQKPIEITPDHHGVRFDVYAKDNEETVYDVEMQNLKRDSLRKRVRYSQSMIDEENLERGMHYSELKNSYVIFICNFNLFEDIGRHKYTFRRLCIEEPFLDLRDGTEIIFLCSRGTRDDVTTEMKNFLKYIGENAPEGDFTKRLEKAVDIARMNPRWRDEYMNLEEIIEERSRLLKEQLDIISKERDTLAEEKDTLSQENDALSRNNDTLVQEKNTLVQEKNTLVQEKNTLEHEKNTLTQENGTLLRDNDKLMKEKAVADARIEELEKMLAVYSSPHNNQ